MVCCSLIPCMSTIAAVLVPLFLFFFSKMDCDFNLCFLDKCGSKIEKLKGKVVWITGASSGIGKELALILAKVGCQLILSGTKKDNLIDVKKQCLELNSDLKPDDLMVLAFDLTDTAKQEEAFEKVLSNFSQLNILVNNAGRLILSNFADVEEGLDEQIFNVNVFAPIKLTRRVIQHWISKGQSGQVVVNSSLAAKLTLPKYSTYGASKRALHGFFEGLRNEVTELGIKITMVCPGTTHSEMVMRSTTGKIGEATAIRRDLDNPIMMSTDRCAHLIAVATVNEVQEAWISRQPLLLLTYLFESMPSICRYIASNLQLDSRFNFVTMKFRR